MPNKTIVRGHVTSPITHEGPRGRAAYVKVHREHITCVLYNHNGLVSQEYVGYRPESFVLRAKSVLRQVRTWVQS